MAIVVVSILIGVVLMSREWEWNIDESTNRVISENSQTRRDDIPEGWKLYSNDEIGFSMYYDGSLTLQEDTKDDVRFYKQGPTQRGQTEMYDGLIVSVRKVSVLNGGQVYIDDQIEQYKNVGNITVPLHESKLNGISVKEYSASGLGDATIIFVPIDDRALLEVSCMAPDPTNAGFQKTIDLMFSTFELHP